MAFCQLGRGHEACAFPRYLNEKGVKVCVCVCECLCFLRVLYPQNGVFDFGFPYPAKNNIHMRHVFSFEMHIPL